MEVDEPFIPEFENKESTEYKNFVEDFTTDVSNHLKKFTI